MFSVILLLLCYGVSATNNENVVSCYWPESAPTAKEIDLRNYNVSKQFINIVKDKKDIHCYTNIWKGVSHLTEDVNQNETDEALDLLDSLFPLIQFPNGFTYHKAYDIFRRFVSFRPVERYENPDWILRKWYPFHDNIIGLAAYKNGGDVYEILEIYNNQTANDIEMNNLEVAGFVPKEFMSKLRDGKSYNEAQSVAIRMMLIFNVTKFKGIFDLDDDFGYLIGVSIPGEYKGDHVPFLKGYFRYSGNEMNWVDFGGKYKDFSPNLKDTHLLSQMVFFGRINETETYDSVEESYCVNPNTGVLTPIYEISDQRKKCLLNVLCFDKFRLGSVNCNKTARSYICEEYNCRNDFTLSDRTKFYYDRFRLCSYTEDDVYCNKTLSYFINGASSYFDFLIIIFQYTLVTSFPYVAQTYESIQDLLTLIRYGLSFLENDKDIPQITPLGILASTIFFDVPLYVLFVNPSLILFMSNSNSDVIGFVVYEDSAPAKLFGIVTTSLLTRDNKTLNYSSDNNVRMIVYVEGIEPNSSEYCNLYVFRGDFVEYKNETAKSDVVSAYCPNSKTAVLKVYIRTRNLDKGNEKTVYLDERYSIDVRLRKDTVSLIYIANRTVCGPMSKLNVFDRSSDLDKNMTYRNVDRILCSSAESTKIRNTILIWVSAFIASISTFILFPS